MYLEIKPVGSYLRQYVMFIIKVINPWGQQVLDCCCGCPAYYRECLAWPLPLIIKPSRSSDVYVATTCGDPGPSMSGQTVVNECLKEATASLMKLPSPTEHHC